jgi:hypothetical protein
MVFEEDEKERGKTDLYVTEYRGEYTQDKGYILILRNLLIPGQA